MNAEVGAACGATVRAECLATALSLLSVAAALLVGCRGETVTFTGRVKFRDAGDPSALAGYVVALEAVGGRIGATGPIATDGTFRIERVTAGQHRVAISPPPPSPDAPPVRPILPKTYSSFETSGLTADIQAGMSAVEFELQRVTD